MSPPGFLGALVLGLLGLLGLLAAIPPVRGQQPEEEPAVRSPRILGAPAALAPPDDAALVALAAGTIVRTAPSERALVLEHLEVAVELPLLEQRGRWLLVRLGERKGWIEVSSAVGLPADLELAAAPELAPPHTHELDTQRIERARASMRQPREQPLGPYRLLTDLDDQILLGRLARVAEQVSRIYEERYGLEVAAIEAPPVVVLFGRESDYRDHTAAEGAISSLASSGHASGDVAVFYRGDRSFDELVSVLLHELGHLLNLRVFGIELPVWLEEGLAEDLSYGRVDDSGELFPKKLRGRREVTETTQRLPDGSRRIEQTIEIRGPLVALAQVIEAWDVEGGFDLERLFGRSWLEFVMAEDRRRHYAEAAFFVRYLVDAQGERHAEAFRSYLNAALLGAPLDLRELLRHTGLELEQLERDFETWARFQGVDPVLGRRQRQ